MSRTPTDGENIKIWVETWKRADSALKKVKQHELRSYDYKKNQTVIDDMLQWACDHQQVRLSSGLVEQQRWFMQMKERQKSSLDVEREA